MGNIIKNINTKDVVKSLLNVLTAALILTIFEIVFFGTTIAPTITSQVSKLVKSFAEQLGQNIDGIVRLPSNTVKAIKEEEQIIVSEYNESVMYDGWWLAGILSILILSCNWYLGLGFFEFLAEVAPFAFGTAVLFALFQVYFYYEVSKKYNYPSQDESRLIATDAMISSLENDLGVNKKNNII